MLASIPSQSVSSLCHPDGDLFLENETCSKIFRFAGAFHPLFLRSRWNGIRLLRVAFGLFHVLK